LLENKALAQVIALSFKFQVLDSSAAAGATTIATLPIFAYILPPLDAIQAPNAQHLIPES